MTQSAFNSAESFSDATISLHYQKARHLYLSSCPQIAVYDVLKCLELAPGDSYWSYRAFNLLNKICTATGWETSDIANAISCTAADKYLKYLVPDFIPNLTSAQASHPELNDEELEAFHESSIKDLVTGEPRLPTTNFKAPNFQFQLTDRPTSRNDIEHYEKVISENCKARGEPQKMKIHYEDDGCGNRVIATKTMLPGEIVYVDQDPLVWILEDNYKRKYCSNCISTLGRERVTCASGCTGVFYCGPTCRDEAWKNHHNIVCTSNFSRKGYVHYELSLNAQLSGELAAKCLASPNSEYHQTPLSYSGLPYLFSLGDVATSTNSFIDKIHRSVSGTSGKGCILHYLREYIGLVECLELDRFHASDTLHSFDFPWFVHLQLIIDPNAFTLSTKKIVEAGIGLYTLAAMVNHSCESNSKFETHGLTVQILLRDNPGGIVKSGDEINIFYYPVANMDLRSRREHLGPIYGFVCQCNRCLQEEKLVSQPI
ncbi:hypothetical protein K7432_010055 [Basidiobolus ranarum]|uniref:MYND-type domain-containing protein n=1 Tax=Basidiobolus ranarum TaxID=34480 RepID=A0ABR2VW32_9FUNG